MEVNIVLRSFFDKQSKQNSRLDAEFASPRLFNEEELLCSLNGNRLDKRCKKYDGPTVNDSWKKDNEIIKYIAIDSIDNEDGLTYSSDTIYKDKPSRAKYVLEKNDILVSNVRPNRGAVAIITKRNENSVGSSGFTLLRSNPDCSISPEFIFCFLKSKYARHQLIRRNRGSMYPAVLPQDVFDIFVPSPPTTLESNIKRSVSEALNCHDIFFKELNKQEIKLHKFLSSICDPAASPLIGPNSGISYSIQSSKDFFVSGGPNRFDAEFFRPEYEYFDTQITSKSNCFKISDYFDTKNGRGPGKNVETIPYIKQNVLTNAGINWSAVLFEDGDPNPPTGRVIKEDILLACTAHEVYYVARKVDFVRDVPKTISDKNICVADIMILRPNNNKPKIIYGSYIAAFLRSPWGLHQVQRCIRGLRGGHVYGVDVSKYVKIPIPSDTWLKSFEQIAKKAEKKRG